MKKILFICSGNVGRSQIAEAFYNDFTESHNALSAGIDKNTPAKYPKIPDGICKIMTEENLDLSQQKVKLINKYLTGKAERIFVMCKKESCPDFLIESNKVTYWDIEDPYQMKFTDMRKIRDQIKVKVKSII